MKYYRVNIRFQKRVVLSDGEEVMGDEYTEEMEASSGLDAKTLITANFARCRDDLVKITSVIAEEVDPPEVDFRKEKKNG